MRLECAEERTLTTAPWDVAHRANLNIRSPAMVPTGPPPVLAFASLAGSETFRIREIQEITASNEIAVTTVIEGKPIVRRVPLKRRRFLSHTHEAPRSLVRIVGIDGEEVAADRVTAVLRQKKETLVVLSRDGGPVDPYYLKLIRPAAWIVYFPRTESGPTDSSPVQVASAGSERHGQPGGSPGVRSVYPSATPIANPPELTGQLNKNPEECDLLA